MAGLAKNEIRAKRNRAIKRQFRTGRYTQSELAAKHGLTQARVCQVLNDPLCHLTLEDVDALV